MKTIIYLCRKDGIHGFLKLIDLDVVKQNRDVYFGEEIHFRIPITLTMEFKRAIGMKISTEGYSFEFLLRREGKTRDVNSYQIHPVVSGDDLFPVWRELIDHAKDISKERPIMKMTETNCHTLVFEALERAGIEAPLGFFERHFVDRLQSPSPI